MAKQIKLTISDERWETMRRQWLEEAESVEIEVANAEHDVVRARATLAQLEAGLAALKARSQAKRREYRDAFEVAEQAAGNGGGQAG
jgi:hypothetical protein